MGRSIIKLTEGPKTWYLEWSSIVDAPITYGMSLYELEKYIQDEYGRQGLEHLAERLVRVDAVGTSASGYESIDQFLSFNRAGPNETTFTKSQIIDWYCHRRFDPGRG